MSALEMNAMYGSITRDIFAIHDVRLLQQLQQYIAMLLQNGKEVASTSSKKEVLGDFQDACQEYYLHKTTGRELLDFDSVLKAI